MKISKSRKIGFSVDVIQLDWLSVHSNSIVDEPYTRSEGTMAYLLAKNTTKSCETQTVDGICEVLTFIPLYSMSRVAGKRILLRC